MTEVPSDRARAGSFEAPAPSASTEGQTSGDDQSRPGDAVPLSLRNTVRQHDILHGKINAAQAQLHRVKVEDWALSDAARETLDQLLETFSVTLEELQVASEELRQQNDELTTTTYQALKVARQRYRDLFELAPGGYVVTDWQGVIEQANEAAGAMFGVSPEVLTGKPLAVYLAPGERADFHRRLTALLEGERDAKLELETLVWGRANPERELFVVLTGALVRDPERALAGVLWLIQDVSALRATQSALAVAEQDALMGRVASSLAHEVGNPLQAVLGCLGLSQEAIAAGRVAYADELLDVGLQELRRAARILRRLREVKRPAEPEVKALVDLNALIAHVLASTEAQCQDHHIDVVWRPAPDLPEIPAVSYRLQQAFLNLTFNAVDAMPDGGTLTVRTERRGSQACAIVADTGEGIPASEFERLFIPFHTTKFSGMGLGLYVTKQVVDEHAGRIEVESQVRQGTTFVLCLPVA